MAKRAIKPTKPARKTTALLSLKTTEKGLYISKSAKSGKLVSSRKPATITVAEIKKVAPSLKKLVEYDKGRSK